MQEETGAKKKKSGMSAIIASLRDIRKELYPLREILLANLVMIGEIPSPTFNEDKRIQFIKQRFTEAGLQNCSTDEMGNALAILHGRQGDKNIVVSAHTDTIFPVTVDHTITVLTDSVRGPGVGDNALGAAVVVSLPTILQHLGIELDSNLVLMGSTRSLGRGNLAGLRFFLSNTEIPIQAGLCLEGIQLGRLSHNAIGMMRCEIECTVPEEYDWTRFGAAGAIIIMNDVINKILEIPLSRRPHTSIVVGSIEGGKSFDTVSTHALLRLEIHSESNDMVKSIRDRIEDITSEVSAQTSALVTMEIISRRRPGGISFTHPLTRNARRIIKALEIEPRKSPSASDLSTFIDHKIPAVTIGISQGELQSKMGEYIKIKPLFTGIAQLIGLLLAIDQGYCNED